MKSLFRSFLILLLCTGGAFNAFSDVEEPTECTSDEDCESGQVCESADCPLIACDPSDEECEQPECVSYCVESEGNPWDAYLCESDADCPAYFSCNEMELPCSSSTPATEAVCAPCVCADCPPGEECEPCECEPCDESSEVPEEEECSPETVKICQFDPTDCSEDADLCSAGFQCQQIESCSASTSGSASSAGSASSTSCACPDCVPGEDCPPCDCEDPDGNGDDGEDSNDEGGSDADLPMESSFEEECEITGAVCIPEEVECSDATDCLDGWECIEVQSDIAISDCACPPCATCPPCPEGEECEACPECPPCDCGEESTVVEDPESYCMPEGWGALMESGWVGEDLSLSANDTNNREEPTDPANPEVSNRDDGTAMKGSSDDGGGCVASTQGHANLLLSLSWLLFLGFVFRRRLVKQN